MEIERNLFLDPGADPGFDPETAADEAFNDNELKELERLSNVKLSLISVETLVLFLNKCLSQNTVLISVQSICN